MILLGSASPRRKELFERLHVPFTTDAVDIDENGLLAGIADPEAAVLAVCRAKMDALLIKGYPASLLAVTADTIVVHGDSKLGKPVDTADARSMISLLSGVTHKVITAVCTAKDGQRHDFTEITEVDFSMLNDKEIERYLSRNDHADKAGAYGIQGYGAFLIQAIRGDYYNVVGFPMNRFIREVKRVYAIDLFCI